MRGLLLKVKKNRGVRAALCSVMALAALACSALAVILLPETDRVTFAATSEAELAEAIEAAAEYGSTQTEIKLENDFTVEGNKLTVIAGKNIRLTGDGVLTFKQPLTIDAEAQVTFDVETVFEGNLSVNGTLTVNSRLYNTAEITVAHADDTYAEIKSEGLIIGGSLNNDAAKGGTITVNAGATLATRGATDYTVPGVEKAFSNHDGGTLMLKNAGVDGGYTLGITVDGTLVNNGSVIYEASPKNANDDEYYAAPCKNAVAATFVNPGNLNPNQEGIYVLYAGKSDANADLLAGGQGGTGTININNNITVTLLAFGKITYNAIGGVRIQITNANLNLGGNEKITQGAITQGAITQGANELVFDGGAEWDDLGAVNYAAIDNTKAYNNNLVIFYNESNEPHYYSNTGTKSDAVNQGKDNSAFFKVSTTNRQTGSLSMYGGAKITNHEAAADGIKGGGVCLGDVNATFYMYGGEISRCAVTNSADNATGGAIYNNGGTVNIYGGAVTHNAISSFGANGSGDAAGIANVEGTVNMLGGAVSYNHGAIYNGANAGGADGGGIQAWGGTAVLNMHGGEVYGNFTGGAGGGIAIYTGTVNMFGGTVRNNRAAFGGGINDIEGKLNISGGEIINNEAFRSTVNGAIAGGYGGGICTGSQDVRNQKNGIITISGDVKVSGNKAYYGGGIAVYTSRRNGNADDGVSNQLKMTGGTIIGNAAYELPTGNNGYYATYQTPVSANGGGVYVFAYNNTNNQNTTNNAPATAMLVLLGAASIDSSNSVSLNYDGELNLNNVAPIQVDGELTASGLGALLYLNENSLARFARAGNNNYPIISFANGANAATYLDKFVLDNKENHLVAITSRNNNYITYNNAAKIVAQISEDEVDEAKVENGALNTSDYYEFNTLKDAFNAANNGATIEIVRTTTISQGTLNGRFYIDKEITVKPVAGKDVTLIVASTANFTQVESLFRIVGGGKLTLDGGNGASRLTVDGNGNGRYNEPGGNSNITLVVVDGGTFKMNGNVYLRGNVTSRVASAVEITSNGGTFEMNGGVIEENTSSNANGSAVYVGSGEFIMNGGAIQSNVTENQGNENFGVYLVGGTLKLSGNVTFTDNQIYTPGSNIYVEKDFSAEQSSQLPLVIPSSGNLSAGTAIVHIAAADAKDISEKFELFENSDVELSTKGGNTAGYLTDLIVVRSVTYIFDPNGGEKKDDKTIDALVEQLKKEGINVLVRNTDNALYILVEIKYGVDAFSVSPITDFYIKQSEGGAVQTVSAWGSYGYNATLNYSDSESGEIVLQARWGNATTVKLEDEDENGKKEYTIGKAYNLGDIVDLNTANLKDFAFERLGYYISGWTTLTGTVSGSFQVTEDLINKDGFIILTAKWDEIQYKISYVTNSGTFEEGVTPPDCYTVNKTVTKSEIPEITREGFGFDKWYTMNGQPFESTDGQTGDIILVAMWIGNSYTVTFDPNEGELPDGEPNPRTFSVGIEYKLPTPTRANYEFKGWYTDEAFTTEFTYTQGETTNNLTLYAKWEAIEYTITLAKNDGTDSTVGTVKYTVETKKEDPESPEEEGVFKLPEAPTRTGYTFDGWYTSAQCLAGQSFAYTQGETTGDITLYAKWEANEYTVKFDVDGKADIIPDKTLKFGETEKFTLLAKPENIKAGYTFGGWQLGNSIYSGEITLSYILATGNVSGNTVTFTAKWDLISYTITYIPNNGGVASYDDYTVETEEITLLDVSRTGYTFGGWYTSAQCLDDQRFEYTQGTTTGNLTLYAKWTAISYTVTYNTNGGNTLDETKYTVENQYIELSIPEYPGYEFKGWKYGENTIAADENGRYVLNRPAELADIQLMAQWEIINYTIIYELNSGENGEDNPTSYNVNTVAITLNDATRTNYGFEGWYTDAALTTVFTYVKGTTLGDLKLYAKWTAITYKINYTLGDGGVNHEANPATYTVETADITLYPATRAGYTFGGWVDSDNNPVTTIAQGATGNITLTAQWTAITYKITYNLGGGVNNAANPATYTIEDAVTLGDPVRTGYEFLGWYTDEDLEAEFAYTKGTTTGDITLYAKWDEDNPIVYTIAYDSDGGSAVDSHTCEITDKTVTLADAPAKAGYTFDGWKLKLDGDKLSDVVYGGSISLRQILNTEDVEISTNNTITFVAQWKVTTYYVTYVPGGGTIGVSKYTTEYDVTTEKFTLPTVTRPNYEFKGWYTSAALTTAFTYTQGTTLGNLTLYAKWEAKKVEIAISAGTGTFNGLPTGYAVNTDKTVVTLSVDYDKDIYSTLLDLQQYLKANESGFNFIAWEMESVLASYYAENTNKSVVAQYSATQVSVTLIFLTGDVQTDLINKGTQYSTSSENDHTSASGYRGTGWQYYGEETVWTDGVTVTESITLQETGEPIEYNLTFDTDSEDEIEDIKVVTFGEAYGELPTPTKAGYTFVNWTDENGNVITAESKVSLPEDHELKANWTLTKYTVIFDLDGGNGKVETLTGNTVEDDNNIPLAGVTKLGYTFGGWTTEGFENSVALDDIIKYADSDNTITLVAQWEANKYTVILKDGTETVNTVTISYSDEATVTLANREKAGYTFGGWALGGVIYSGTVKLAEILSITGETKAGISFTAQWRAEDYTVNYNMSIDEDSASKDYINPNPVTYTVDADLVLEPATRDGYTFNGWLYNGSEIEATNGKYVIKAADLSTGGITITAQWTPITYYITYNLDSDVNNSANPETYTVETAVALQPATRTGYTFEGWFDGSGNQVSAIAKGTRVDYELEARWSLNSYTITYELNGGINNAANPTSYNVNTGNITLKAPTRAGYEFLDWEYNGSTLTNGALQLPEEPSAITITAQWTPITYTVKLIDDGETAVTIAYSDEATVTLPNLEQPGYTFLGWRTGNSTYQKSVHLSSLIGNANSNNEIILTAVWSGSGVESYEIIYELNGGTLDQTIAPHSYSVAVNRPLVDPVKAYHKFLGWYSNPEFTGDRVTTTVGLSGDLHLYAKWQREVIDLNGSIEGWTYGEDPNSTAVDGEYNCAFLYGTQNSLDGSWSETVPTDAGTYYVLMYVKYDGDSTARPTDKSALGWSIVEFTIAKKVIAAPALNIITSGEGKNDIYTGSDLAALLLNYDSLYMRFDYSGTVTTTGGYAVHATNAGAYTVTVTLTNANYLWEGEGDKTTLELVWTVAKQKVALPEEGNTAFSVNGRIQTYLPEGFDANVMNIKGNREAFGGKFKATVTLKDTANYEWADGTVRELRFDWTMSGINKVFVIIAGTLGGLVVLGGVVAVAQILANKAKKRREAKEIAERSAKAEENSGAQDNAESEGAGAQDNAETQNGNGGEGTK